MHSKSDFFYKASAPTTLLYKEPRGGFFHTRFMVRGRSYRLSTGVKDARMAQEIAYKRYCDIFFGKNESGPKSSAPKSATVGDCLKILSAEIVAYSGQKISATSARGYSNALRRLLASSGLDDSAHLNKLTPALIQRHRAARYSAAGLDIARDKDLILNYSLNSETTNALSAFSETALALYKERGLKIPDNIQLLKEVRALPAKKPEFIPIDPDTDALMIRLANAALDKRAFGALTDAERRNVPSAQIATVFELARFCSLTCKEIQNAKWDWLESDDTIIRVSGDNEFSTKWNAKDRRIPVDAERVRRWKAALRPKSGESYLIDDSQTTRRLNITAREANTWIKKFIPARKKGLHELRKMATSDFLRSTNGDVYRVANIIGDNPRTMLNYYAAVLKMDVVAL
jgi:hypothetical protein